MQKIVTEVKKIIDEGEAAHGNKLSVDVAVGKSFLDDLVKCCSAEGLSVLVVEDVPENDAWNTEVSRPRPTN